VSPQRITSSHRATSEIRTCGGPLRVESGVGFWRPQFESIGSGSWISSGPRTSSERPQGGAAGTSARRIRLLAEAYQPQFESAHISTSSKSSRDGAIQSAAEFASAFEPTHAVAMPRAFAGCMSTYKPSPTKRMSVGVIPSSLMAQ
jgi:hypothetical protein